MAAGWERSGPRGVPLRPLDPITYSQAKAQAERSAGSGPPSGRMPAAPRVASLNGTYVPGLGAVAENYCCSPPDTTGAIGPNHYVEMTNSMIAVYHRDLSLGVESTLTGWLGVSPGIPYCDPQIQWDPMANRWFYAFLFCNPTPGVLQDFHFGWSKTSDPSNLSTGWCHFVVSTGDYLMDFPKLGHDNNFLVVTANGYDTRVTPDPAFVSVAIWVLPKPTVGSTTCTSGTLTSFGSPASPLRNADGSRAFTAVPANTVDSWALEMIVAAHAGAGPQNAIMTWHLKRNRNGTPSLVSDGEVTVAPFSIPSVVPQPGAYPLDSSDTRLTQAVARYDPGLGVEALWTQHTIADPGGSGRSVVRWYEIGAHGVRPNPLQQGNVGDGTDWLFNAAISPTAGGDSAVLVYDRAGASDRAVIEVQSRHETTPMGAMDPGAMAVGASQDVDVDSTCYVPLGGPCRWGDYSGATPDISGGPSMANVVWGVSQITGPRIAQTNDPQWESRIFAVTAAHAPDAPTGVIATAGSGSAYLRWIAPASNGAPITSYVITPFIGSVHQAAREVSGAPPGTTAVINGLANSTTYTFTVAAINEAGTGPPSQPSGPVTPAARISATQSAHAAPPIRQQANQSSPSAPPTRSGASPALPADEAVAFQIDVAHSGSQPLDPLTPPLRQKWSVDLSGGLAGFSASYAVIAGGRVFAVAGGYGGNKLFALDVRTGANVWGPIDLAGTSTANIAYDNGQVFTVNNSTTWGGWVVQAFDAGTGSLNWHQVLPSGAPAFDEWYSPPIATNGFVYITGQNYGLPPAEVVVAMGETDGGGGWTQTLPSGVGGSPAAWSAGVYVACSVDTAYGLNPTTGVPLWRQDGSNISQAALAPVLHDGRLYVRDSTGGTVYDARTGRPLGTFASGPPPAFAGSTGYFLVPRSGSNPPVLRAIETSTGSVLWSFTGDGGLVSAPIVVNGYVYIASQTFNLYAVNATTGAQAWDVNPGSYGYPEDSPNVPTTGLSAAEGTLVIPVGQGQLIAYGD